MLPQLYTIVNTTGNTVVFTDSNGNSISVGSTISPISLTSDQYNTAVSVFGAENISAYVIPPATPPTIEPNIYGFSLSGSSQQILPAVSQRSLIRFHNPNATAIVWYSGGGLNASANGAGSFELLPGASDYVSVQCNCAWTACCSGGSGNISIMEYISYE